MPYTAAIGGAVIAASSTAYGVHEQQKATEQAEAVKPPTPPQQPLGAQQAAAAQVQQANLLSQSAGGTLLSDPAQSQGGSRPMGSAVGQPAGTKLGTGT